MNTPWRFAEDRYAGGQPTPAHLAELVREGVHTVINLRAPEEPTEYDEAAEAARLGLHYVSLPIAGAADRDRARVREFRSEERRVGNECVRTCRSRWSADH